jgi:redox-sensitive bicupin YhaK (pirin superfamily)
LLDDFHLEANSLSKGIGFWPHFHSGLVCTLTYIYPGQGTAGVSHQDHKGHKGVVNGGGIQFMSSGKGIIHSEMPATNEGISGLQLWVCADKEYEEAEPGYQEFTTAELPEVTKSGIWAKVIAGEAFSVKSPLNSTTPINYVHYKMPPHSLLQHKIPTEWNAFMYCVDGEGHVGDNALNLLAEGLVCKGQSAFFKPGLFAQSHDQDGCETTRHGITVTTGDQPFEFLVVAGKPLHPDTKILQRGPVIHSSQENVERAFEDFYNSRGAFEGGAEFMKTWSANSVPKQ